MRLISGFGGMNPLNVARQAIREFGKDNLSTQAAALTYQILLAIFPFLIFLLTLLNVLKMDTFFNSLLDEARSGLSADLYSQFETIIAQVRSGANGGLLSFGLILAVWSSASGVRSMMHAMDVAYDVKVERGLVQSYLISLLSTIGLAAMFLAALALMFLGPQTMEWLADFIGLGNAFVTVWTWLRIPVGILLMVLAVAMIYYFFPNIDQQFRVITPGSVVAVAGWVIATRGFSFYLNSFANYNATYGSLAGIIILLFYFYISSSVLLLGAEVNAVIDRAGSVTEKSDSEEEMISESQREA